MNHRTNTYAQPTPELLIPASRVRAGPAAEILAQLVAVLLLLVAWVAVVWMVSSGLLDSSDPPPAPVIKIDQPAYLTA